jgi:hypothetical protein
MVRAIYALEITFNGFSSFSRVNDCKVHAVSIINEDMSFISELCFP